MREAQSYTTDLRNNLMITVLLIVLTILAAFGLNALVAIKRQNYVIIEMIKKQNGWVEEEISKIVDDALK